MSKDFHSLKVKQLTRETEDTTTIAFEIPDSLSEAFQYKHGQYLTLKTTINGEEVRRAYSMSSSPVEDQIAVSVKKVEGGKMSTFLNDKLAEGSAIDVMPPEGRFFTKLDADQKKSYYLFGAGSGITPLMSILKTILELEPLSTVYLLYGNRNEDLIIFKEQLDQLLKKYEGQLFVEHILSQPKKERGKGLGGWLKKSISWSGKVGRIDGNVVKKFLEDYPDRNGKVEYFICGPGTMIDNVENTLQSLDIDKGNIHTERFVTEADKARIKEQAKSSEGAILTAHMDGQKIEIVIPPNKSVLDALLDKKYDAPYSCTAGACSTCMAKVIKGSVRMETCYALDDDEIESGYILTCQAFPTTPDLEITFEV